MELPDGTTREGPGFADSRTREIRDSPLVATATVEPLLALDLHLLRMAGQAPSNVRCMESSSRKVDEVPVSPGLIERRIYMIRGRKVMLDRDLADLYRVPTKSLNLAVKRNRARFPQDFMFQLDSEEAEALRFQIETSKSRRGGRRYLPYAFTEQGVAMLSGVLRGNRAVHVNVAIMHSPETAF